MALRIFVNLLLSVLLSAFLTIRRYFWSLTLNNLLSFFLYTNTIPEIPFSYFILKKFILCAVLLFILLNFFLPFLLTKLFRINRKKCFGYISLSAFCLLLFFTVQLMHNISLSLEKTDIYENMALQITPPDPANKKNLILIIAESLENTYADEKLFGKNLLSRISSEAKLGQYYQTAGTDNTASATTAILCGIPSTPKLSEFIRGSVSSSFSKSVCISDILHQHGYDNYFYTSDSLPFANKNLFLRRHHFDEIKGAEELYQTPKDAGHSHFNGISDTRLFDAAYEKLSSLKSGRPFFMIILTLNMHDPDGFLEDRCKTGNTDKKSAFLDIVQCSDKQIAAFINKVQKLPLKDTVFIIAGDHLARPNPVFSTLNKSNDRMIFSALVNAAPPPVEKRPFLAWDMGASILSLLGFGDNAKIGLGVSLYSPEQNLLEKSGAEKLNKELMKNSEKYNELLRN